MKLIIVATDGSEGANRALDHAVEEAKCHTSALLIVNVIGREGILDNIFMRATEGQQVWLEQMVDSLSAETLTKARNRAQAAGIATVHMESRTGEIAETIIAVARERHADLIVAGRRGVSRTGGLLLGSVSQKLVSLSPIPVTVVP
jgi:nucleotide-binding universal stress UspA family protein